MEANHTIPADPIGSTAGQQPFAARKGSDQSMTNPPASRVSGAWINRPTDVRITLGEFCLAKVRFRAATLSGLDWRFPLGSADEMFREQLQTGVEVVYVPSLPVSGRLPRLSIRASGIRYVPGQAGRCYIDLEGTFQEYLAHFGSKPRKNLVRSVRLLSEASGGTIDFREYRTVEEAAEFYTVASNLSEKTYQEKLLKSGLPQTDDFRRAYFELARQDRVRGYILFLHGEPIAYAYCTTQNDIFTYQIIGYDPAFAQHSPGTVLLYLLLEGLFSEKRFTIFDFGTGEASYKKSFSTGESSCAVVYHFRYSPKNLIFLAAHSAAWLASISIVKSLSALRIKGIVKKLLRSGRLSVVKKTA